MDKQEPARKTSKPMQIALLIVLILILATGGYFLADALGADDLFSQDMPSPSPSPTRTIKPSPKPPTKPKIIHVRVMGAVQNPGEYVLPAGAVYQEAVEKAGGYSEDADIKMTLMGTVLKDGALIMVPRKTK